ncbi:MAG: hypothetical protein WCG44_03080 [bacterium]
MEVDMSATKKRKSAKNTVSSANAVERKVARKVEEMSEQMQMLLIVFSVAMMAFAYVLYKVYAQ